MLPFHVKKIVSARRPLVFTEISDAPLGEAILLPHPHPGRRPGRLSGRRTSALRRRRRRRRSPLENSPIGHRAMPGRLPSPSCRSPIRPTLFVFFSPLGRRGLSANSGPADQPLPGKHARGDTKTRGRRGQTIIARSLGLSSSRVQHRFNLNETRQLNRETSHRAPVTSITLLPSRHYIFFIS